MNISMNISRYVPPIYLVDTTNRIAAVSAFDDRRCLSTNHYNGSLAKDVDLQADQFFNQENLAQISAAK